MLHFPVESQLPFKMKMVLYELHYKIKQAQKSTLTSCLHLCFTTAQKL